jgi:hypothetical protein
MLDRFRKETENLVRWEEMDRRVGVGVGLGLGAKVRLVQDNRAKKVVMGLLLDFAWSLAVRTLHWMRFRLMSSHPQREAKG